MQFVILRKKNFIMNYAWNHFKIDDGTENYLCFTNLLQSPSYLFEMTPRKNTSRPTRESDNIPLLGTKYNFFQNGYFSAAIKEWNRLDTDIQKSDSISIFKIRILSFIRPLPNKVSNSDNPQVLKLLTRLRQGLSHLRYHKFKHNFLDTINPLCSCGYDTRVFIPWIIIKNLKIID